MDKFRFDSWPRRRVGPMAVGIVASLVDLFPAIAKKKRKRRKSKQKRRKCKKIRESCVDGGRRCCHGRTCGGDPANGTFCCQQGGESCGGNGDCCNLQCLQGTCALN